MMASLDILCPGPPLRNGVEQDFKRTCIKRRDIFHELSVAASVSECLRSRIL